MNRYQKEKSREIRDIMRTDRFGRMTYKEARRQRKKAIRAFRSDSHRRPTEYLGKCTVKCKH